MRLHRIHNHFEGPMQLEIDQLLREQESCIVITLQSPRGKTQNVFLVLLNFGHGPVLALQTFLLTLGHLLGIIDQNSTPLIQLLHDLQNGHLDINLHSLLHIRHLADRASNLLGVFLKCGMFVPKTFHQ